MDLTLVAIAALTFAGADPAVAPADAPSVAPAAAVAGPRLPVTRLAAALTAPAPRDSIFEYSPFYYKRLTLHRWGSYTMLPLFAAQYLVGSKLYNGTAADGTKDTHEILALSTAGLFAINTTTGLWNLWDGRKDPKDRGRRFTHAAFMLVADAGFVTTGIIAGDAEQGGGGRASTHRAVAISSMVVSTVGWLMMTDLFRKD